MKIWSQIPSEGQIKTNKNKPPLWLSRAHMKTKGRDSLALKLELYRAVMWGTYNIIECLMACYRHCGRPNCASNFPLLSLSPHITVQNSLSLNSFFKLKHAGSISLPPLNLLSSFHHCLRLSKSRGAIYKVILGN